MANSNQKKDYDSPKITRVNLRSDEAVLGNCKSGDNSKTGLGTMPDGCKYHGSDCSVTGS